MKRKRTVIAVLAAVLMLAAGVAVYAAANYGSASDPLVTVSYLRDVVQPTMADQYESALDHAVDAAEEQFSQQISTALGAYVPVALAAGETLTGNAGTEVLLRSGAVVASGVALVDSTSGGMLAANGKLAANHLYLLQADGSGVRATGDAVLMVRGACSVS